MRNDLDNGMGPGPGMSCSDYSGSPCERWCDACGRGLGVITDAQYDSWYLRDDGAHRCDACEAV